MHRWFLSCYCYPKCNQHQLLLRSQSLPFLCDELLSPSLRLLTTSHTHCTTPLSTHAEVKEIEECKRNSMSYDTSDQSECPSRQQIRRSHLDHGSTVKGTTNTSAPSKYVFSFFSEKKTLNFILTVKCCFLFYEKRTHN